MLLLSFRYSVFFLSFSFKSIFCIKHALLIKNSCRQQEHRKDNIECSVMILREFLTNTFSNLLFLHSHRMQHKETLDLIELEINIQSIMHQMVSSNFFFITPFFQKNIKILQLKLKIDQTPLFARRKAFHILL